VSADKSDTPPNYGRRANRLGAGQKGVFPGRSNGTIIAANSWLFLAKILQGLFMLRMTGVSKAYRADVLEIFALRNFSIRVDAGEFIAVTGPSGCGKTTFLTIAGMLDGFNDGEYQLDGVNVDSMSDQQRSQVRNEKIGFIFQSFNLLADLSIHDNVEMPLRYRGLGALERQRRVETSLSRVGLSGCAKRYPTELSGGQQQRVAIARALAGSPRVLLADEPTANLNEKMAAEVMDLLQELHRDGATIVVVTHSAEMTRRAQREVRIVDGSIVPHPLLGR
jgi:putative ABC transport system ATP-binding protein